MQNGATVASDQVWSYKLQQSSNGRGLAVCKLKTSDALIEFNALLFAAAAGVRVVWSSE